jgi:branched-chain amino acid transport system substrate-binding protein
MGYLNSHSGFMAFTGTAWRNGFLFGVDEINGAGGINGHKVDVVMYDDGSDVAKGVLAYKKLINTDKVLMTSGISHTAVAMAVPNMQSSSRSPTWLSVQVAGSLLSLGNGKYRRIPPKYTTMSPDFGLMVDFSRWHSKTSYEGERG